MNETQQAPVEEPPATATPATTSSFVEATPIPVEEGPLGIRFDFNNGARVTLPPIEGGGWLITLTDLDTGNILFHAALDSGSVVSSKRYYVRFRAEAHRTAPGADPVPVWSHDVELKDRRVVVQLPVGTLGDTIGWFPYVARFGRKHGCRLTCVLSKLIIPLLQDEYPHIRMVPPEEARKTSVMADSYAGYNIGLFFNDADCNQQPTDFRLVGLHRTAAYILGVDPTEAPPVLGGDDDGPPIDGPYVCIAVQASSHCKKWNNPHGWREVISFLKERGFRVVCIDQLATHGAGLTWTSIPHGVEDQTGNRPLTERLRWLRHATMFVGLSSGLSWLAWAVGCPVVMVSGFTHPTNEFATPYRVINWHACNSCWNDQRVTFDHTDYMWCPRHKDSPRQMECSRLITGGQVTAMIENALKDRMAATARHG